jgi:hypothetical protein
MLYQDATRAWTGKKAPGVWIGETARLAFAEV